VRNLTVEDAKAIEKILAFTLYDVRFVDNALNNAFVSRSHLIQNSVDNEMMMSSLQDLNVLQHRERSVGPQPERLGC